MEDHEIAEFWKAHILGQLWTKRPRAQDFAMDDIAAATGLCPGDEPDEFFDDVVDWMIGENLIGLRADERIEGQVFSARLTSRALGLMAKEEAGWTGAIVEGSGATLKKIPAALATGAAGLALTMLKALYLSSK